MRMIERIVKAFAVVTALLIVQLIPGGALSGSAYADEGVIGTVTELEGETKSFDNLSDLVKYVGKNMKGKTFTIDMLADWGNKQMAIEDKSKCTFNMHGHMYNRGLTDY